MLPEELALCQLGMMVFSDSPPRLDLVYMVTETRDNAVSVTKVAAEISRSNNFLLVGQGNTLVAIGGFTHPASYSPKEAKKQLEEQKVLMRYVREINYPDAPVGPNGFHHTGTEMAMVARFAHENNCESIGLIAAPFHQLRSYLFLLTALHRAGHGDTIKVFNCPGVPLDWNQEVFFSQGETRGSRTAILAREIQNTLSYWKAGYLISPVDALGYFVLHRS